MTIPLSIRIAAFTVVVTAFYTYVGQMVPQKEVHPPEVKELKTDMTTAEMVETGKEIAAGKGQCLTCHTIGKSGALRYPDLEGIGSRAADRIPGMGAVEYLAQSLYEPEAYIVSGFNPGMPVINKPPIGLTDEEILTVIAYLQSLGSTPTVTMDTRLAYMEGGAPAPAEAEAAPAGAEAAPTATATPAPATEEPTREAPATGEELFARYGCGDCHAAEPTPEQAARSVAELAAELDADTILIRLLHPPETEGHGTTEVADALRASGFSEEATVREVQNIVGFIESTEAAAQESAQ